MRPREPAPRDTFFKNPTYDPTALSKRSLIVTALLLVAAVAGCLEPDRAAAYQAYGSKGSYTSGFAYNGRGIVPFDGPIYIAVNNADNTGQVIAEGTIGPTAFRVLFEQFAPSKPFHDGGIASNLIEHGDSGVGDTSIPRVDLEMAGWGKATIHYGGQPYADPLTGNLNWTAHFMVIRNGVRDNATGAIYGNDNKTTVYDPKTPAEGHSAAQDYEVHVVLRNGTATSNSTASAGGEFSTTATAPQPSVSDERTLFTVEQLGSVAKIQLTVEDAATRGSNITFRLRAPSGAVVLEDTLGDATISPGTMEQTRAYSFNTQELGDYVIMISGRLNPGGTYSVRHTLEPPAAIVLNLWWEAVLFGKEAEDHATTEGLTGTTSASPSAR